MRIVVTLTDLDIEDHGLLRDLIEQKFPGKSWDIRNLYELLIYVLQELPTPKESAT